VKEVKSCQGGSFKDISLLNTKIYLFQLFYV
jgi:hypothetical protein